MKDRKVNGKLIEDSPGVWKWDKDMYNRYQNWWMTRWVKARKDIHAGRDAITRATNSSWWNWDDGSHPFFW